MHVEEKQGNSRKKEGGVVAKAAPWGNSKNRRFPRNDLASHFLGFLLFAENSGAIELFLLRTRIRQDA